MMTDVWIWVVSLWKSIKKQEMNGKNKKKQKQHEHVLRVSAGKEIDNLVW